MDRWGRWMGAVVHGGRRGGRQACTGAGIWVEAGQAGPAPGLDGVGLEGRVEHHRLVHGVGV